MTEAEYVFKQDIREKKSIKNSASKTNRTGKGPVRMPSDYLSRKEKLAMNGPVKTWSKEKFYTYSEFKEMPDDFKVTWLNYITTKYDIGLLNISKSLFQKNPRTLHNYISDRPEIKKYINIRTKGAKVSKTNIEKFESDVSKWRNGNNEEAPVMKKHMDISESDKPFESQEISTETLAKLLIPDDVLRTSATSENPTMSHASFEMNGLDVDFLKNLCTMFGDRPIRVSITIDTLED